MSSKDYFAAKLASGTAAASKMASWWPKHCHVSMELLAACADGRNEAPALEKQMVEIAEAWEKDVPSARARRAGSDYGLMVEHAVLEVDLIYAVLTHSASAIGRVADRLMDNAKVQGTRYAHAIANFPSKPFNYRIQEHVELFVDAVRSRLDRNARGAAKCAAAMDANMVALASLATEWF